MDPLTLDRPLPDKIGIIGFADSKDEAPYDDPSWEMWGVNDVYAHVKRIDRSFEIHDDILMTDEALKRRNPAYKEWLSKGKIPVYMTRSHPDYPSCIPFPKDVVMQAFGNYFTNSVAWMTGLALMLLTEVTETGRTSRPNVELGFWGVDMAADSEYAAQRPSCEYYIGIACALGVKTIIPETSDLLKTGSLYGFETSAPQRIKIAKRINVLRQQHDTYAAQEAQLQAQINQIQAVRNQLKGAIGAFKYTMGVWTMPTEVPGTPGDKERLITPHSDGQVSVVNENGELDITPFLELEEEKI